MFCQKVVMKQTFYRLFFRGYRNGLLAWHGLILFWTKCKIIPIQANQTDRSSHLQMFFKIGILKNFAIFPGKHLCWSLFLIKLQAWRPAPSLKRDSNRIAFLWILQNFQGHFFYRTPTVATLERISFCL